MKFKYFILFINISFVKSISYKDNFSEELFINNVGNSNVYTYFQFTTQWKNTEKNLNHCHLFPHSLSEILQRFQVDELHISLTEGLWRYENWGYPVVNAPPGAEVWAWFSPDSPNVDNQWKQLTQSLSGLLCASLNFIDQSTTVAPQFSFRPQGIVNQNLNNSFVRYSTLPREIVCTENLTPWKKLLPCRSRRGLATLLNSAFIHNTRYHSLSLSVRSICTDSACTEKSLELKQTVSLVYDPALLTTRNWSLRRLFGQGLGGSCHLASESKIYVDISHNITDPFKLIPSPTDVITSQRGGSDRTIAVYDVKNIEDHSMLNIALYYTENEILTTKSSPALHANRYLVGYGQERGGISTRIYNNHWGQLDIVLFENLPWFIPVYRHTLQVVTDGVTIKPKKVLYIPGRDRLRPYHLEVALQLPPRSVTTVSIDFEYMFLKWQEYPPDANHGFYVGSSVISCLLPVARNYNGIPHDKSLFRESFNASRKSYFIRLRTEMLLVTLPTPDFSMPYNVICLACTVVALAFGPLHNITTKRLKVRSPEDEKKGFIANLKSKLFKVFCWQKKDNST